MQLAALIRVKANLRKSCKGPFVESIGSHKGTKTQWFKLTALDRTWMTRKKRQQ